MNLGRIVFAPIYLTALALDKVATFLWPREGQIIAGSLEACELTSHSNDDRFARWEAELQAKENNS